MNKNDGWDEWTNEWLIKLMNEWTNEWLNELMNDLMN